MLRQHLYIKHYNKYRNYNTVQSQWTLTVYKNIKGCNYGSYKVKDLKDKETTNLGNKGQTKDFNRKRHLSGLHSRTNSIRKKLV